MVPLLPLSGNRCHDRLLNERRSAGSMTESIRDGRSDTSRGHFSRSADLTRARARAEIAVEVAVPVSLASSSGSKRRYADRSRVVHHDGRRAEIRSSRCRLPPVAARTNDPRER